MSFDLVVGLVRFGGLFKSVLVGFGMKLEFVLKLEFVCFGEEEEDCSRRGDHKYCPDLRV